ncbi:MAG: hypothetical protein WC570_03425 [Patescibacteria group bacterium]
MKNSFSKAIVLLIAAAFIRWGLLVWMEESSGWVSLVLAAVILLFGGFVVLKQIAEIIEETTGVLSVRTKIAGGLLQSFGTAFPDMILGLVAAVISLQTKDTDLTLAINYAIIAAATTFGSNIYNIGHAVWCIYRQNIADQLQRPLLMFPGLKSGGTLLPIAQHKTKPTINEINNAIDISMSLTVLTAVVALAMVIFGQVKEPIPGLSGDLYQLVQPVGGVILVLCILVMYFFRHSHRPESPEESTGYFHARSSWFIFLNLAVAGLAILFTAESMVKAIEYLAHISHLPYVIAGVAAGFIGCLGEMIVVHNFSVNPTGRIGDAIVGVAMDNIVTLMGASIVAVIGGIFLGGNALILIFVIILTLNTALVWQMSKLKNIYIKK